MKASNKTVLVCLAALALAACGSTGSSKASSSQDSGSRDSSKPAAADSGACKLMKDNEGRGKNLVYRCNIAAVMKTADAQANLNTGMAISYGGTGELRTNATSRSFGRDEAVSCERAVINGLNNLQNPRHAKGTVRRLSSVGSYAAGNDGKFQSGRMAPAGYADCIVATWQSRTVMRGTPHY